MRTFKHSGDLGDIIYSLYFVQSMGGGDMYLNTSGETKFSEKEFKSIKSFLESQSYITSVSLWKGEEVDFNLDLFRNSKEPLLIDRYFGDSGVTYNKSSWLSAKPKGLDGSKTTIFSRSCRYQNSHMAWESICKSIDLSEVVFVGHRTEYEAFKLSFGVELDYLETKSILDLAEVIQSANTVFSNANVVCAVAHGLCKPLYHEVYRDYASTAIIRENAKYF